MNILNAVETATETSSSEATTSVSWISFLVIGLVVVVGVAVGLIIYFKRKK